ncbi:MAG: hypothetical protein P8X63_02185, partial [Desulfuromonadaceae bacterium]
VFQTGLRTATGTDCQETMTFSEFRPLLSLSLLATAPLAGFWFGEGHVPLVSIPASCALLVLAFGATFLSPTTRLREKYYLLLAAAIMFVGAWAAGHSLIERAIADCLQRGDEVRSVLENYRSEHGGYPQQLEQLGIPCPGRLHLHTPLLQYQQVDQGYRLFFIADQLRFEATHYSPFVVQRLGE